jgi:serine protease
MSLRSPRGLPSIALLALVLGALFVSGLDGQDRDARRARRTVFVDGRAAIDGEVLVRFRESPDGFEANRAATEVETDEVEPIGRRGAQRLRSRRLGTHAMLEALRANPDVEYAEPNYLISVATLPNDPFMINLWGMFNAGQSILGIPGITGADSGAHNAWDIATGSRANVVAVIDSGIDYTHPDLAANIWTAPRAFTVVVGGIPITCPAGSHGFNAITNSCNPMDDNAHGTHVAGTIGAVGMNGVGVVGVNWVASMMGIKFLAADGFGSTSDAVKAIEFAIQAKAVLGADANVRILSNSWGGAGASLSLANQIVAANNANMLFVAAAGNGCLLYT